MYFKNFVFKIAILKRLKISQRNFKYVFIKFRMKFRMDNKKENEQSNHNNRKRNLYIVSVFGPDRTGICKEFSGIFARRNLNIIDVEAIAMRGYFIMPFLVDFGKEDKKKFKEIEKELKETALRLIYGFTSLFAGLNLNVERMKTIGREDLAVTEYRLDIGVQKISEMRKKIYEKAGEIGVDVIVRDRNTYERTKKLVVFDLDGTLIDKEIIDEIAKFANVEDEVKCLTKDAMEGKIEFKKAIRERVNLFKGMDVKILEDMAKELEFTPEAKELIYRLKELNYKLAIISGAFTIFTDALKEK
ncbi:MAG: hypothetical protein CVT89_09070, partial [Candidatus Altiarchaeales archaeon HGW-Altiarchaeales-2]